MNKREELINHIKYQITNLFTMTDLDEQLLEENFDEGLERTKYCISKLNPRYQGLNDYLPPLNNIVSFLLCYYTSNTIVRKYPDQYFQDPDAVINPICIKLYQLNRTLNLCDVEPAVNLPDVMFPSHPIGTTIGYAKFGSCFYFLQNCTIGLNCELDGSRPYPEFGDNIVMYSGSSVIGRSKIGNNVVIGANTVIKNQDVPDNALVFGESPNLIIRTDKLDTVRFHITNLFDVDF